MDKQIFLNILEQKLSEYPITAEDIKKHVQDMEKFLATVSDEDFESENPTEEDIESIAITVIKRNYGDLAKVQKEEVWVSEDSTESVEPSFVTQEPESEAVEEAVQAEEEIKAEEACVSEIPKEDPAPEPVAEESKDVLEILAMEAEEERKDKETYEELKRLAIERAIAEQDEIIVNIADESVVQEKSEPEEAVLVDQKENDPVIEIVDPMERPDIAYEETEAIKNSEVNDKPYTISDVDEFLVEEAELVTIDDNGDSYELKKTKRKKKREKVKGTPLFWTLFILTLPITLPLLLSIAVLFGIAYVAVTGIIIAFAAAMISCVAIGTALSLIGIIYGITETLTVPVLGAFEIGLGVAIGGITILVSVLLYNIAIRFAPFLYKCITRLAKFVIEKLLDLFYIAKKECGR
ncbi:MAG: hypothetical protein IKU52_06345 [Clostridia bacterium]|nr:hypothetical protein [Clostridia bacterium]